MSRGGAAGRRRVTADINKRRLSPSASITHDVFHLNLVDLNHKNKSLPFPSDFAAMLISIQFKEKYCSIHGSGANTIN